MPDAWDDIAPAYDRATRASRAHRAKYARLSALVREARVERLLDLGCGTGLLEEHLFDDGYAGSVTGVDSSAGMLVLARAANLGHDARFERVDLARTLPFEAAAFDGAVVVNVLFLLDDPLAALREVHRVLTPGATLLVVAARPQAREQGASGARRGDGAPAAGWRRFWREHFAGATALEAAREAARVAAALPALRATARFRARTDAALAASGRALPGPAEVVGLLDNAGFTLASAEDLPGGESRLYRCERR